MSVSFAAPGQTPETAAPTAGQVAYAAYRETKVFGALDGLRAIAILSVLWHHAAKVEPGSVLASRGFLGVDLFFVISGFLITTLLLRERERSGSISLRRFYARRFLRIFPVYYLTLAFVAATVFLKRGGGAELRHDLPYAFLYLSNLVPMTSLLAITWSLSTEEQFYLVAPALEKHVGKRLPWFLCVAFVLVILPTFGLFPSWDLPAFFRQTTFGPILLGVLLAHALHEPRGFEVMWRVLRHPFSPALAFAVAVGACCNPVSDISGWPRLTIQLAFTVVLASCVIRERHALLPALRVWPLRRLGIVSYGIYLFHMLVLHFVEKGTQRLGWTSNASAFVLLTLVTWAVAEVSFRLYESRFLALKARFEANAAAPARAA